MKEFDKILKKYIDEKRLFNVVKEVSNFHRIQGSSGFLDAANHVLKKAKSYGLDAKIINYEANPEIWTLESKLFKEWSINEATLDLVEPNIRLADYSSEAISIIQKSYPIDKRDNPVELIYLDKGPNKENYEDLDLKDKMVFVRGSINQYDWIFKKGALGIITDFVRETPSRSRNDLYDSLTYTSFWHAHTKEEGEPLGFVLSPRMGDKLASLCKEKYQKDQGYLKVKPYINSSLFNGHIQVVEINLKGEDDKKVLLTAHLCHPRSSANDNASGVSASLEALNAINKAINNKELPPLKHSIRLLLIPEFTGTFAYLSDHQDYEKYLGGLNLDMVGARQTRKYGPITLTRLPFVSSSIVEEVASYSMRLAGKEDYSLNGEDLTLTNNHISAFSGGSDHTVFSDPTIGIPTLMLGQWPDLNYHTATDTIDVIDSAVLKYSSLTAAIFAYKLANLTKEDLLFLYEEMEKNILEDKKKLYEGYLDKKYSKEVFDESLLKLKRYYLNTIDDIKRIIDVDTSLITKHIENIFDEYISYLDVSSHPFINEDKTVYARKFIGPVHRISDYKTLGFTKEVEEYEKSLTVNFMLSYEVETLCTYYIDGIRSVSEIIHEINLDLKKDVSKLTKAYIKVLYDCQKLEIVK